MSKKPGPPGPAPEKAKATSGDVAEPANKSWMNATSYWADERVPLLADLLQPHRIDPEQFADWLGPKLGKLRGYLSMKSEWPTPKQEAAVLRQMRQHLDATTAAIQFSAIPPLSRTHLMSVALKDGCNWFDIRQRLTDDLIAFSAYAAVVERMARAAVVPRGRKPATRRNELAAAIFAKLQELSPQAVEPARDLAKAILHRCGVAAPDDLKRSVRKGQKQVTRPGN